ALAYIQTDKYREAVADCDIALVMTPNNLMLLNNRGIARAYMGDTEGAIADCTKAIMLDPEFSYAYGSRGFAHMQAGDLEQAKTDLAKAVSLDETNTRIGEWLDEVNAKLGDDK
ncbi:MAG: tetratricopeptide repeat protein, partial [Chloroflexota bacterium]